jgi:hypothetical protein
MRRNRFIAAGALIALVAAGAWLYGVVIPLVWVTSPL